MYNIQKYANAMLCTPIQRITQTAKIYHKRYLNMDHKAMMSLYENVSITTLIEPTKSVSKNFDVSFYNDKPINLENHHLFQY